jgi:Cof subfamily protein (haloacid dehalogenase superfamily)
LPGGNEVTRARRAFPANISALVSDVDGTLLTDGKLLTRAARSAVAALGECGIPFAITSSRPPRGLRMLVEALGITTPLVAFNGGVLATPDLEVIEQHLLPPAAARRAVETLVESGVEAWVYAGQEWLVRNPEGPLVAREARALQFPPVVVEAFGSALDAAGKIVGVSEDAALLARCERKARALFDGEAAVARSQPHSLEITHPLANKGTALLALSRLLAIPSEEIAVIGDGGNDVAMFGQAGLSIAMGNAAPSVRRAADLVTESNEKEGFAKAVASFVIAAARSPRRPAGSGRDRSVPAACHE